MKSDLDFELGSSSLCREVKKFGFTRFDELAEHVRSLPYGRPKSLEPLAVLSEQCGTCSSKHQLLAQVAQESGQPQVQLTIGIYEMSERNTPGVADVLAAAQMSFIPEAHCYLTVEGERLDFTGICAGASSPFESLLCELCVAPARLQQTKVLLHKEFLNQWSYAHRRSSEELWRVREACIAALSANKRVQPTCGTHAADA